MILDAVADALATELLDHLREVEADALRTLDTEGINYTRATANGLYAEVSRSGFEIEGAVGSRGRGALYAHDGRRPGKWPPDAPIREWLRVKKGVAPGPELDRATYLLRRKIGRRGTRATRFLARPFEARATDLPPRLARAAERALSGVSVL